MTRSAIEFADHLHRAQRRDSDQAPFILHPLEVASLLFNCGASDRVVAAGVLHDVIEDTSTVIEEIQQRFGAHIAALVAAVTEEPTINSNRERKAALRAQVADAGPEATIVFAADKLSKVRELRSRISHLRLRGEPDPSDTQEKLEHYVASLKMLEDGVATEHPLVRQLRFELETLGTLPPGTA